MSIDDSIHEDRIFDFKPEQLEVKPGETKVSILTISASPDARIGS